MMSGKHDRINIRLLSMITIWLLVGISFLFIFTPIVIIGEEENNSGTHEIDEMNTPQQNSQPRGTRALANSPWPMFRGNVRHTGLSPYNTGGNDGQLKWKFNIGNSVQSSPSIDNNNVIYVGSDDNKVYAIYPNGTKKWDFTTGGDVTSSPAISSDGTIYAGSQDHNFYAINPNGTQKWNFFIGDDMSRSSPAIGTDGTIYVGSENNKLYALYPNGTQKWNFTAGDMIFSSPGIDSNGTIYFGSCDQKLYAINPDGTQKWNYTTNSYISWSSPAVGSTGIIYIGSRGNNLYAIFPNGTEKWNFSTNSDLYSSPAIGSDGIIYIGSMDYNLYAIYPNGTKKWSFSTNSGIMSSPAIGSDGTIYIGSRDRNIYALYSNGTKKWNFTTQAVVESSPTISSNGTIYMGGNDGILYAIGSSPQNQPPIANAGQDQNAYVNQTVYFDGSGSYDLDNDTLAYNWAFGDGTSTNWQYNCNSSHVYNKSGEYTVTLFVTDGLGGWGKVNDTCKVKVSKGPPLANSPWPKFRGNLRNTGLSPYDTSNNSGKLKWTFTPDDYIFSSPVIDTNGTIYFGSRDYRLYAINQNGTHRWNFTTGYEIHSTPAISSDGTIYVGSNDFKLYAINPNGSMKWSFATGDWVKSPPAIGPDGTIYVGSNDGKLYAINPNGTQKWNFTSGYVIDSSPAIGSDGTIYCNVYIDSILYAINPNGTMKWSYKLGGPSHSSPAIGPDGTIYVGSTDMNIYAIKQDGTKKWSFKTYDGVFSSPAIGSDGTIYIGSKDSKIYAIYPNGNEKWSFSTNSGIYTSPAIDSKGILYLGADDGELYAINPNGSQKWSYSTRHWVDSSPAIGSDGSVYICSWQVLHAIGTKPSNHPPIANAGPDQNVTVNQTVNLDGSSSYDPDEDDLTYQWDFGDGSSTDWQNSATITHSYSESGDYIVTLTVSDGSLTDSETCTIYVSEVIKPYPIIAENFPTLIELDEDFGKFSQQLTDFESHWDSEIIGDNLKWYVTGNSDTIFHVTGDNSTGENSDTIIFNSIVNQHGNEVITYHLRDPFGSEAVINQTVIVHPVNDPPIASAGPNQNITLDQSLNLDGNGSYDIEGDILVYEWTSNIDGKLGYGVILKNIKLSEGIHTITLTVNDGELIGIDTCIVRVSNLSVNLPPVAKIKPIVFAIEGEIIYLSAADSFDSDGYITAYIWNFGDNSEEVTTNTSEVEHTWSSAGNYTITLTVIDNQGMKDSVSLDIIVVQSDTIDSDDNKKSQNNTFEIILVAIVIIILLLIASLKIFLSRSKRQREQRLDSDEEILSEMKHKFLQDEPLSEMEYSRNEISEILETKFKTGQLSEDTYHFIKSEVLFSDEIQSDQIIKSELEGKE